MVAGMRIFMTGATGYIGGAVASTLRHHGHDVTALVRPESESRRLRDLGVVILSGDLDALPALGEALDGYDSYIHIAFAPQSDRTAIDALAHRGHFIYTSGVWVLGNTRGADETSAPNPLPLVAWRVAHEGLALQSPSNAVLRPGCVYGGKQSLCARWFAAVDQNQPVEIVGEGRNHWAMIDLHDLAACYVAIVEQRASGVMHAIDDTRATLDECAQALAPRVEISHVPGEGDFADALLVDQTIESRITRERLGWTPKRTFTNSIEEQWREWRSRDSG